MEQILKTYSDNIILINLVKDFVYFLGFFTLIKFMFNWNFVRKTKNLEKNLSFREKIEPLLNDYVLEKDKNGRKDIGIRFLYWKNYPNNFSDDAYIELLNIKYHNGHLLLGSWIDSAGLFFRDHIWYYNSSIYIDNQGFFMIASENLSFKGFTEYPNTCLVKHLPYSNIVNYDFKDLIEYEPVFYVQHYYKNYKKLYSRNYIVREKPGSEYISIILDKRKLIKKFSMYHYNLMKLKIFLLNLFDKLVFSKVCIYK